MRTFCVRAAVAAVAGLAASAGATPLRMDYCVTDLGGGQFRYHVEITLDNNDGSWSAGQGFGWFIFGDAQAATSPINDFVMDPAFLPIGPFTQLQGSGGFHNGPTLGPVVINVGTPQNPIFVNNLWIPNAIGDSLVWEGTSATNLAQGAMLWSNLMSGSGSVQAAFVVGELCGGTCYPDCNNSGSLTVADFTCFQGEFLNQTAYGDCNNSGTWTVADFTCFQVEYLNGCP